MHQDTTTRQASVIPGLDRVHLPGAGYAYSTSREVAAANVTLIDLGKYAAVVPEPTRYSIQVGIGRHVDGPGTRYLNHSCEPNVFVDAQTLSVVSLAPLAANVPLQFFYPANEWLMTVPFKCGCKTSRCIGTVAGAAAISGEILQRYRLNQHIHDLLRATTAGRSR